jgi:cytochrome P450
MNPLDRYNPYLPLILWYNNRRLGRLIHAEIMKRYEELKHDNMGSSASSAHDSKSIITLTLKDYLKEEDVDISAPPSKEFLDIASAQVRLFLFAGHDTTSSALNYCYHALSEDPHVMQRLRAEHDQVFSDVSSTADAITKDPHLLNQLPYTLAVIKECLRL